MAGGIAQSLVMVLVMARAVSAEEAAARATAAAARVAADCFSQSISMLGSRACVG